MKRVLLLLSIFAFFAKNTAFAQSKPNVDSLVNIAENYLKNDTTKINMWLKINGIYQTTNPTKGLEIAKKALTIAQQINLPYFIAESYKAKGNCFLYLGENSNAIEQYNLALPIYQSLGQEHKETGCLVNIAGVYFNEGKHLEAIKQYEKAKIISEKLKNWTKVGQSLNGISIAYMSLENYSKGIEYSKEALSIAQRENNKKEIAICNNNLGIAYDQLSDYPKSLDHYLKALTINEELRNTSNSVGNYINISRIYSNIKEYDKALEYNKKGLKLAEQLKNKRTIGKLLLNQGSDYLALGNYNQALEYNKKGLSIMEELKDSFYIIIGTANLANSYSQSKNYSQVIYHATKALGISTLLRNNEGIATSLDFLGNAYIESPDDVLEAAGINSNERLLKAEECFQKQIVAAEKASSLTRLMTAWKSLSKIYEKKGDYIKAYQAFNKHIAIKDSISGDDVKKKITRKEIQYEFDKKETALKYEQQLTADQLEKQKLLTIQGEQALTLNQQNLTLKEQALALSNKEKDLVHLAYLKEQAEKQEKTQELSLSQEREKGKEKDLSLKNLELSAQQKQNLYLGLFSVLLLGGLGLLSYFYTTLKKQKNIIAQQNELNEQTIAILSHDIKEPLLGVKLLLKKLNKDDPFVAQASQSLENQINSVNGILNNLLKMKKLSLSKKDKNATANVQSVVQNVIQELNVAIQSKALAIQNELEHDVTLPIAPEKLQIVVHNLLSNAVKYSFPNQSIRIFQEDNGFSIQDFGVGLSPEQRSKIMREVTASQQGTKQERGNGLGLFLVGALLQGEQLKVIFDSPEVGGTVVKILS
jgi:signal transduction histidine kinase